MLAQLEGTVHLERVRAQHVRDLADGTGSVELPVALERKYPGTPETMEPTRLLLVQSNLLGAIEGDIQALLLKAP